MRPTGPIGRRFALVPLAIAILAICNLSIPYYALAPGPTEDVKGLLTIEGTKTYPSRGKLLLTTVSLRSVLVADTFSAALDPTVTIVPRQVIVPPTTSEREQDRLNARHMQDSKVAAASAALKLLDIPVRVSGEGVRVEEVGKGLPAEGVLRAGDVVVGVNGRTVGTQDELISTIQRSRAGTRFRLQVRRGEETIELAVRTVASPEPPGKPVIGVQVTTLGQKIDFPFEIEISSGGIGGPSAGLMFALAIVDQLTEGDLANGRDVAGTGVISLDGDVGKVGGVVQKVAAAERAGAEVFLVPSDELEDARRVAGRLRVIGVSTLAEAVEALRALQQPVSAAGRGR